ncbi:MAG: HD-like signal output (HDOD) protein [Gammaproteobacteria bacterium]|jgi:HD-like signal output (HDOD) protein
MKYVPSEAELKQAFNFIKGVEIPKIPDIVLALQQEITKREPDVSKIGGLLATDIALSGIVLKTINSVSFGLSRKIESIPQACVLLGLNTINEVILGAALKQSVGEGNPFQTKIWRAAQGCALGAKAMSLNVEGVSPEEAYLAGLFHDAGALLMEKKHPEYAELYRKEQAYPISLLAKETECYGTNHVVIGFLLANHWKLPEKVSVAIYNSHIKRCSMIDDPEIRALIAILKITDSSAAHLVSPGMPFSDEASRSIADAYMELLVDSDMLLEMKEKIEASVL